MLKKLLHIKQHESLQFWVSHLLVVGATIVGVYLAASAGFKLAVQFELVRADRDTFYEIQALSDELRDNLEVTEEWGTAFTTGSAHLFRDKKSEHQLDLFIWKTMQYSSGTFEIPANIISGVRRYYSASSVGLDKMTDSTPDRSAVDRMLESGQHTREQVLPLIDAELERLRRRLVEAGVTI